MIMNPRFRKVALASIMVAGIAAGAVWTNKVKAEQPSSTTITMTPMMMVTRGPARGYPDDLKNSVKKKDFAKAAEEIGILEEGIGDFVSLLKKYETIGGAEAVCFGIWSYESLFEGSSERRCPPSLLDKKIKIFSTKEVFDCFSKYKNSPESMRWIAYYLMYEQLDGKSEINLANFFSNDAVINCISKVEDCLKSMRLVDDSLLFVEVIDIKGYTVNYIIDTNHLVLAFTIMSKNARGTTTSFARYIGGLAKSPIEAIRTARNIAYIPLHTESDHRPSGDKFSGERMTKAVLEYLSKYEGSPEEAERMSKSFEDINYISERAVIAAIDCLSKYHKLPRVAADLADYLYNCHKYYPEADSTPVIRHGDYLEAAAKTLSNKAVVDAIIKFETSEPEYDEYGVYNIFRSGVAHFFGDAIWKGIPGEMIIKAAEKINSEAKTYTEAEGILAAELASCQAGKGI